MWYPYITKIGGRFYDEISDKAAVPYSISAGSPCTENLVLGMQGLAIILIALLVSPLGIPMIAMKVVFLLGSIGDKLQEVIY